MPRAHVPAPPKSWYGQPHHPSTPSPLGDIALLVGHRFTTNMGGWGQQQCEVLSVTPVNQLYLRPRRPGHHH